MANQKVTESKITVNGRGSLVLPYKLMQKMSDGKSYQVDLSSRVIVFEIDGIPIKEEMVADPADPLGKLLVLENDQIVKLSNKSDKRCIIRDETNLSAGLPVVLWDGTIGRDGYIGEPDGTDDA